MNGYLGEFKVKISDSPFANYTPSDWALEYIRVYGGIDGAHHKTWVLDQVARILNGAPVKVTQARWIDGTTEYRYEVGSSPKYKKWVKELCAGEDGPNTYDYDEGIAP